MVNTDKLKIVELITRGVENVYPTREALIKVLESGKKIKLYQGFDPTGPQLHIGSMAGLLKLKQFQELGHKVIFLIGDITATIGDPSGKTTARKVLPREEVKKYAEDYKRQAGKILDFSGKNPVEVKYNSDWYDKMSALEFAQITHYLTFAQISERDLFQERKKSGQDVFMNEFVYPMLQAYDSVAMDVDLEVGGSDQMFNMMMGRKLMRNIKQKEKFVMTLELLTDSAGKKIGKTEGNVIAMDTNPNELFGMIMSLPDDVIIRFFELVTRIPMDEVKVMNRAMLIGKLNPRDAKARLAKEIVTLLHSKEDAEKAEKSFSDTFGKGEIPTDIQEIKLEDGQSVMQALVSKAVVSSGGEWRRLVESGAVKKEDGTKIEDINFTPTQTTVLRIGKKTFVKIVV